MRQASLHRHGGRSPTSTTRPAPDRPVAGKPTATGPPGLAVRGTWLAIAVLALLIVAVGTGLQLRERAAARAMTGSATVDGLTATLQGAGWVAMDGHNMGGDQPGYQMPAQMMPGAPVGDDMRLGVPLTLMNTGDEVREFNLAEEFSLGGGRNSEPRRLHSDTFGPLARLSPGSAIDGVLYFDTVVPGSKDAPLYVVWQRDGQSLSLAVNIGPDSPDHGHTK